MKAAVFLDRDGTIIEDVGYPKDPAQVRLVPGAVEALKELKQKGFALVVISNQSGVGRGMITEDEARRVHERFVEVLREAGIEADGCYYCPHAPEEGCPCRKPEPGMLIDAARDLSLDLSRSFMVGDKVADADTGQRVGGKGIFFNPHHKPVEEEPAPDHIAADWPSVVHYILNHSSEPR